MDPRLPARACGVPAGHPAPAEVLAPGSTRGQRARRQERVLQLHPDRLGRRGAGGVQRAGCDVNRRACVNLTKPRDAGLCLVRRMETRHRCPTIISRSSSPSRSEEHTSELQSLMRISYAVFCLKKKTINLSHIRKSKSNTHHRTNI